MTTEIAECMAAGIEATDIDAVAEMLQQRARSMDRSKAESLNKRSIRIMKMMARSGVESKDALSVVTNAFQSGFNAKEMEGLEYFFNRDARWTTSVSDLAKSYAAAIKNGETFTDIDSANPRATSFGSRIPGPGGPGGSIPPGPSNAPPRGTPGGAPPGMGGPGGRPSGAPPGPQRP